MNKRDFLKIGTGVFSTAATTNLMAKALNAEPQTAVDIGKKNSASAHKNSWQRGFTSVNTPFEPLQLTVQGQWPTDAYGNFYRNGPALRQRGSQSYNHWFDGDGMVQQFTINNKGIHHQGQFIATEKYLAEEAAQTFLYDGAGKQFSNSLALRNADSLNPANTALLSWDNELLALWEAGSAYRLDPENLTTFGKKAWREDLEAMPFSAHPLFDQDGSLWNFGMLYQAGEKSRLLIYHLNSAGVVLAATPLTILHSGYIHAFAQTRDYLLFYFSASVFTGGKFFVDSFHWQPQLGSQVLVVAKNATTQPHWFQAPPGFVFHFGNAWQDGKKIHVLMAEYADASVMTQGMYDVVAGKSTSLAPATLSHLVLDIQQKTLVNNRTTLNLEFPNFSPDLNGPGLIYGTHQHKPGQGTLSDSVIALHPEKGIVDQYYFDDDVIVEEPLWIAGDSGRQYIIASFFAFSKQQSGIAIFNATALADGPLAMAKMDRVIPLGFHGCFNNAKKINLAILIERSECQVQKGGCGV